MVCQRPFMQLNIAHNGMVQQCCSDALNQHIMGDDNTQSRFRIWSGNQFMKVRNSLIGKGELNNLCKICDLERAYEIVGDLRTLYGIVTTPRRRARWTLKHTLKAHYAILRREGLRKYILYSYSNRKSQILTG